MPRLSPKMARAVRDWGKVDKRDSVEASGLLTIRLEVVNDSGHT